MRPQTSNPLLIEAGDIGKILSIFNPTGLSLAAEAFKGKGQSGWGPICSNKLEKGICRIAKGVKKPCEKCPSKDYQALSLAMLEGHINGKARYGTYPLALDGLTAWVASDLDNHTGNKDPNADLKKIVEVCRALQIPILVFNSNSGTGFHIYIFFDKPIPACKARRLMLAIIERAALTGGSFDDVFPKQDSLIKPGEIGNLIAVPFNGKAAKEKRTTLLLDTGNGLLPYGADLQENIEYFLENLTPIDETDVDRLLSAMGEEGKAGPNSGTASTGTKKERLDVQTLLLGVAKGRRNDSCARLAGYFLSINSGDVEQTKTLLGHWNERNLPPLDLKEVERTVESIGRRNTQEEITEEKSTGLFSKIEILKYPDGDKKYNFYIEGFDGFVQMETEDLTNRNRFKTKYLKLTEISPHLPKGDLWDNYVTETLKSGVVIKMTEEETDLGAIITILKIGFNEDHLCADMERVDDHVVLIGGMVYTTISYLVSTMKYTNIKLTPKAIGGLLRRLDGVNEDRRINGRQIRVWKLEKSKIEKPAPADPADPK